MMVKHEWRIGAVTITVLAPGGVPVKGARVDVEPASTEEFLAAAEAVGGVQALSLPQHDASYAQNAYIYGKKESPEGELTDFDVMVAVQEPPRQRLVPSERPHPFFSALTEARGDEDAA